LIDYRFDSYALGSFRGVVMLRLARPTVAVSLCLVFMTGIFGGCSGNGVTKLPPPSPIFTSSASTSALEGTPYTYQLSATDPAGGTVSFALTSGPSGAALSGNALSWTPAPQQSRIADNFSVIATTTGGGRATQSWSVTPNGTVHLSRIDSFWTANGETKVPFDWARLQAAAQPVALVPQGDGSLLTLTGSGSADGTFTIPNVPGGHYWLDVAPLAIYWTSSSTVDIGRDIVGQQLETTSTSQLTSFALNVTSQDPFQTTDWLAFVTDLPASSINLIPFPTAGNSRVLQVGLEIGGNIDFSQARRAFLMQYEPVSAGTLTFAALGPEATLSNVSFQNGVSNDVSGALVGSAPVTFPLSIKGTEWAAPLPAAGPSTATPVGSVLTVSAQPFVTGKLASPLRTLLGPDLPLLSPLVAGSLPSPLSTETTSCRRDPTVQIFTPPAGTVVPTTSLPPILTDQDFGSVQYQDPFPAAWTRFFSFCEKVTVALPIPNSTATTPMTLAWGQNTAVPTAPVSPLVSVVRNPTVNGANFFASNAIDGNPIRLNWSAPSGMKPIGYEVQLFVLLTPTGGTQQYFPSERFATAETSMTLPANLPAGLTFVAAITAVVDGQANIESSPNRSGLPTAFASVVSAPMTMGPATLPLVIHGEAELVPRGRLVEIGRAQ
jgi:hypothetical protein